LEGIKGRGKRTFVLAFLLVSVAFVHVLDRIREANSEIRGGARKGGKGGRKVNILKVCVPLEPNTRINFDRLIEQDQSTRRYETGAFQG
jgi:hypothetical protein